MPNLDYSNLEHHKKQPVTGYTRKNSFYVQGNGKLRRYQGPYTGDTSVFKVTRGKFIKGLSEQPSESSQNYNGKQISGDDYDKNKDYERSE